MCPSKIFIYTYKSDEDEFLSQFPWLLFEQNVELLPVQELV